MQHRVVSIPADNTASAVDALRQLWPRYGAEEMIAVINGQLRPNGYHLVGIWGDDTPTAAAVLGYRIQHSLWLGKSLYVVDIATLPAWRGHGFGERLMAWAEEEAARLGCAAVHLDSGVGSDRAAAHRLYMRNHYRIGCHHFVKTLD
jgi:GNAT superfamily N-acetyltransferase